MGAYSLERRLAFIHIPKTAGWSVKLWLRDNVEGTLMPDPPNGITRDHPAAGGFPIGHVRLADWEHYTGHTPDEFDLIIAVVRDPYRQQLSQWMFWWHRWATGGRHPHDYVASRYNNLTEALDDPRIDFHVWYRQHWERDDVPLHQLYKPVPLYDYWWTLNDGTVPDNLRLVRLEELDTVLPRLVEPHAGHALPEIPRENTTPLPHPPEQYYTPRAVQKVDEKFVATFEAGLYNRWDVNQIAAITPGPFMGWVQPGRW